MASEPPESSKLKSCLEDLATLVNSAADNLDTDIHEAVEGAIFAQYGNRKEATKPLISAAWSD